MSSSEHAQAESISVRLPPRMAAQLDQVMARDGYMHRSECVRRLLAAALLREVGAQRPMT
jgi:metal-responsive CopG/Arc/MetJ family transcriptional regulator